jgi:hypothetical protein
MRRPTEISLSEEWRLWESSLFVEEMEWSFEKSLLDSIVGESVEGNVEMRRGMRI